MTNATTFALLGGIVLQFASLAEYQFTAPDERPSWLKGRYYWSIAAGMVLVGGCALRASSHGVIREFMVPIQVGMAAPELLNISARASGNRLGVGSAD